MGLYASALSTSKMISRAHQSWYGKCAIRKHTQLSISWFPTVINIDMVNARTWNNIATLPSLAPQMVLLIMFLKPYMVTLILK